jgi:opacity protein-like surface antigen
MINPVLLEGRVQWNDNFSTNLGLGLWNSGYKSIWNDEIGTTATIYKLTDNKALPSLQFSVKGLAPIGRLFGHDLTLFAEPKIIFLPFSARTTYLNELYYTINADGEKIPGPSESNVKTSLKSDCHARFYYGIQGGLSINIHENFDLSVGYGYSNIDLFKDLRGKNIKGFALNNYLPAPGMQLINITLHYNYNQN